jgi:hypothetical protein
MSSEGADNPLEYPASVSVQDRAVNVHTFLVTADVRVNRVLDVGVAAGRSTFFSPTSLPKLFRDLPKTVFTPVRVTVRPFSALTDHKRWAEFFSVRVVATKFNGGFSAEEFGAQPGTFREPGELVWGWAGIVDLSVLFWR